MTLAVADIVVGHVGDQTISISWWGIFLLIMTAVLSG